MCGNKSGNCVTHTPSKMLSKQPISFLQEYAVPICDCCVGLLRDDNEDVVAVSQLSHCDTRMTVHHSLQNFICGCVVLCCRALYNKLLFSKTCTCPIKCSNIPAGN